MEPRGGGHGAPKKPHGGGGGGGLGGFPLLLMIVVVGTWAAFGRGHERENMSPDRSQMYPNQGQAHIAMGDLHPAYNSNPPTSGWHYAQPAEPGFYTSPLPDEQVVHNLEHGEIWIAYDPALSPDLTDELRKYAGSEYVIITPRAANTSDIALAAWTRLDAFNVENGVIDHERIKSFIRLYADKGPEKIHMVPAPLF